MPTSAQWVAEIKDKKHDMDLLLGDYNYNHPHRLASVGISGAISYVIDERDFTANATPSNGDIAYLYTFDLDFTGTTAYQRIFESRCPFQGSSPPAGTLAQGDFLLVHSPKPAMWTFETIQGAALDPEVVGTCVKDKYIYNSGTTSWDLDATTANDISIEYSFGISLGGDPTSGGRDDDSTDEKAECGFTNSWSGDNSLKLTQFTTTATRFPWDDPWTSETDAFSTIFSDFLTDANTADGSGHSGTCTLSLDFF